MSVDSQIALDIASVLPFIRTHVALDNQSGVRGNFIPLRLANRNRMRFSPPRPHGVKDEMKTSPFQTSEIYSTKDLGQAAVLMAAGVTLNRLAWREGVAFFVFDDALSCRNLLEAHWKGHLRLPSKHLLASLHELKDRLFNGGQYEKNQEGLRSL